MGETGGDARAHHCARCLLADLCHDEGLVRPTLLHAGEELPLGRRRAETPLRRGAAVRVVCAGCLKTVHLGADGAGAITALHLPGETVHPGRGRRGQVHHVAVGPTLVRSLRPEARPTSGFWRRVSEDAARRIERDAERMASLLCHAPPGRLAGMLLELRRRRHGADTAELPLRRGEVADYLGVEPETVSRAFGRLEREGLVVRRGWSRVELPDPARLQRFVTAAGRR